MDLAEEAETIGQAVPRLGERVEVITNDAGNLNLRGLPRATP